MELVPIGVRDLGLLEQAVGPERYGRVTGELGARARELLEGREVVNISSTAAGGGVAEMLHTLLGYVRSVGVDARWVVIEGNDGFFAITKRVHNGLYGDPGDGGPLEEAERLAYEEVLHDNAAELAAVVGRGDIAVLHDPQTAGLAGWLAAREIPVVWRCHVGVDTANEWSERAWAFIRPYLEPHVDRYVFTREDFAPDWVPRDRLHVIAPSIDPASPKNQPLGTSEVLGVLAKVGILSSYADGVVFTRTDGSPGRIEHYCDVLRAGPAPPREVPLVVQVSRWDRMKDMEGVMRAFGEYSLRDHNSELVLAGPVVSAVADDPEGAEVLNECTAAWRGLPHAQRSRIHLVCLPMADLEENGVIVNALQRHATVVTQKSLAEGFGLTVVEALYKGTPVIGSAVGGIVDQIRHGETGLLVDPADPDAFVGALDALLSEPERAREMGAAAREWAIAECLPDRHLERWFAVMVDVLHES